MPGREYGYHRSLQFAYGKNPVDKFVLLLLSSIIMTPVTRSTRVARATSEGQEQLHQSLRTVTVETGQQVESVQRREPSPDIVEIPPVVPPHRPRVPESPGIEFLFSRTVEEVALRDEQQRQRDRQFPTNETNRSPSFIVIDIDVDRPEAESQREVLQPARTNEEPVPNPELLVNKPIPEYVVNSFGTNGLDETREGETTKEEEEVFRKVLIRKMVCEVCMANMKQRRCPLCSYSICLVCYDKLKRLRPDNFACPHCRKKQDCFLQVIMPNL